MKKNIEWNQLNIINHKKAEMLSRVIGFQLPQALITFNFDKNIASEQIKVNTNLLEFPQSYPQNSDFTTYTINNFQKMTKI